MITMPSSLTARVLAALDTRDLASLLSDVCRLRGVTPDEVCGRCRTRAVSHARRELWWRIRQHPERNYSFHEIGAIFDRDHSTIRAGVVAFMRAADPQSAHDPTERFFTTGPSARS